MKPTDKEDEHENDELFPKTPDYYERNYGEYAEEKMLDDRMRSRNMK